MQKIGLLIGFMLLGVIMSGCMGPETQTHVAETHVVMTGPYKVSFALDASSAYLSEKGSSLEIEPKKLGPSLWGAEIQGIMPVDIDAVTVWGKTSALNIIVAIYTFDEPMDTTVSSIENYIQSTMREFEDTNPLKDKRIYNQKIDDHSGVVGRGFYTEPDYPLVWAGYWLDNTHFVEINTLGFKWTPGTEGLIKSLHVERIG